MNQALAPAAIQLVTETSAGGSLLGRVLSRVLPAIIAAQLVIGWLASAITDDMVSRELERRLTLESKHYARVLTVKVEALLETAGALAENDLIINAIVDAQERSLYIPTLFASLRAPGPPGAEVTLTDYKGRLIASNQGDPDYQDASFSEEVLSGIRWHGLSEDGFTVAVPVMMSGAAEGMIVIRYDRDELESFLRMPTEAGPVAVVTREGAVLYSSNEGLATRLTGGVDDRSGDWAIVSSDIPWFANLRLLTGRLKSDAFAVVDRLSYFLWAAMLASIAAVTLAIVATALMGTRPILRFIGDIEGIARTGDLDRTVESRGTREFHRLAGAFNRMLQALRSTTASRDELQRMNQALDSTKAKLEESETRFKLAVDGSRVGIWDWDARTNALFWSDRMKRLVGVTDETFVPDLHTFEERLHPGDRDRVLADRHRHLAGDGDYDVEARFCKEDGSYMWLHLRGQAIWDEKGKAIRLLGSADDISERKTIAQKLDRHARDLERSNRELDDFAHIASHDLKEPLRAIFNHASFLLEDHAEKLNEDGKRRLDRLIMLSRRMEKLIADLLYYSRLGRTNAAREPVNLNAVIADIEVSLADMMRQRNVRLVIPEPLPDVVASRPHMMTVLQNLITNAIKYNDSDEKVIEIGTNRGSDLAADEGEFVFYVRDNGIGIEDDFKDDVFRIFKRLNSEKMYGEGTGAGLTFVKKIIENRGGRIWFESVPGEGTTFRFTLGGGET